MIRPCQDLHPDPATTAVGCHLCHLYQTRADYRALWGGGTPMPAKPALSATQSPASALRGPCFHLGERTEFRPGCGGRLCAHVCEAGEPVAVPGGICQTCTKWVPEDGVIVVDQGASGIGDALLGLLAVKGLRRYNNTVDIEYRVSDAAIPWVELFDGGFDSLGKQAKPHNHQPTPGARQMNLGYPEEWAAKLATGRRVDRYCRNVGAEHPAMPEIYGGEWLKSLGAAFKGRVVLAPWCQDPKRMWPLARWIELEKALIADGWQTAIIGAAGSDLSAFAGRAAIGLPPEWVAGILLNSRLVIANDSGMAHLAGILGCRTLVVGSGYDIDNIYGAYPRVMTTHTPTVMLVRELVEPTTADTLDELYAVMRARLGGYSNEMGKVDRDRTMPWLLEWLTKCPKIPQVVETGCQRSREDWSAGCSTWLFSRLFDLIGWGHLTTVDNDATHLATAKEICKGARRVSFIQSDSVAYLKARTVTIDFAYLDSLDVWHPGSAEHGLAEAKAVAPLMTRDGLIVFDDTPPDGKGGWQGKGAAAVPWLVANGWRVRPESGYQTILERVP